MHSVDEGLRGSFGMSMEFVAVLYSVDTKPTWPKHPAVSHY